MSIGEIHMDSTTIAAQHNTVVSDKCLVELKVVDARGAEDDQIQTAGRCLGSHAFTVGIVLVPQTPWTSSRIK